MGRISKEVLRDKETCPRGHPSKLSSHDQHSIIREIRSGRLDNAVQVTQFIIHHFCYSPNSEECAEEELFLLCNKEKGPYVKEDPQAEEVRVCTLS